MAFLFVPVLTTLLYLATLTGVRINPQALKTIRSDREVSKADLARAVGCNPSHLSNIEAGRREASPTLIKALARALRVDLLALLGPEERDHKAS
jgi:transcriptional regulator with XRE-family HTH domain